MHLFIASMPIVPLFLFKLSLSLGLVWCFYQAVLRRLTFYRFNRLYLVGYTLVSFLIPMIDVGPLLADRPAGDVDMLRFIPAIGGSATGARVLMDQSAGLPAWTIVSWILIAGTALMLTRLCVRWFSLLRLRHRATPIDGKGMKVFQVDDPVIPFSFGNAIYINRHLHSEKEWDDIILHEYVHIRERHTIDIIIAELVCVVNWYNPFAWLIRYSIRQNLEFIADQQVLENGVDRRGYQYHLLKVVGEPGYRLANNFNFSSLRKRIVMMNKMRSARVHLLKLLFLLPLLAVSLVAFRNHGARPFGSNGRVLAGPDPRAGANDTVPDIRKAREKADGRKFVDGHRDSMVAVSKYLGNEPVYIIGGREVPADTMSKINPDSIASMDVLKDSAAMNSAAFKKYGKKARNGVVIIHLTGEKSPLCLVDGREISWDSAKRIQPGLIESMQVWKGDQARERYGDKGKNGVVVITLKGKGPGTGN
ncbi:MAG TPA: M56 family metallopeptidase [Puia sp.]|nr:M56 family metallopeptidase [Puia sp.]